MRLDFSEHTRTVTVAGCGGTGGYVAEGLCRLLPKQFEIQLIDHDTVERRNLQRQNFFRQDIGKFKSQALAERFNRQFGRKVLYSVKPLMEKELRNGWNTVENFGLLIGCVDNAEARRVMSKCRSAWWIDAGNGRHSGQVLIGNLTLSAWPHLFENGRAVYLPSPVVQQPSLLVPVPAPSCAEDDGQSPVINRAMAALVLQFVHLLIEGKLEWMGAYIDLEQGTLSTVPAEPKTVARMLGVKEKSIAR